MASPHPLLTGSEIAWIRHKRIASATEAVAAHSLPRTTAFAIQVFANTSRCRIRPLETQRRKKCFGVGTNERAISFTAK